MAKKHAHKPDDLTATELAPVRDDPPDVKLVLIEVPVAHPKEGYQGSNVQVGLNGADRVAMRRLKAGLERSGAMLRNGSRMVPVKSGADVFRWLLQHIQEQSAG